VFFNRKRILDGYISQRSTASSDATMAQRRLGIGRNEFIGNIVAEQPEADDRPLPIKD
jgi:hypothetical protein